MIMNVCSVCSCEVDNTNEDAVMFCTDHPQAFIDSVYIPDAEYYRAEETLKEWEDSK